MSRAPRILPALTFSGLLSAAAGPAGAATLLPDFTAATFIRGATIDNRYLPMRVGSTSTQVARGVEDGRLVERTRDYFAQHTAGNVWYMGEDVTNFE